MQDCLGNARIEPIYGVHRRVVAAHERADGSVYALVLFDFAQALELSCCHRNFVVPWTSDSHCHVGARQISLDCLS
jgi:hypothetical protein